jgi:hypothetical protein
VARIARLLLVSEEVDAELVEMTLVVDDPVGPTVLVTTVLAGAAVTHTVLYTVLVSVACDCSGGGDWVAIGSWSIGGVGVSTKTIDGIGSGAFGFGLESAKSETRNFSLSTSTYSPPSGDDVVGVGGETQTSGSQVDVGT